MLARAAPARRDALALGGRWVGADVNFPFDASNGKSSAASQHSARSTQRPGLAKARVALRHSRVGRRARGGVKHREHVLCSVEHHAVIEAQRVHQPPDLFTFGSLVKSHSWRPANCRARCKLPFPSRSATAGRGGKRSRGSGQQRLTWSSAAPEARAPGAPRGSASRAYVATGAVARATGIRR